MPLQADRTQATDEAQHAAQLEYKRRFQNTFEQTAALLEFESFQAISLRDVDVAKRERRGAVLPRSVIRQDTEESWSTVIRLAPRETRQKVVDIMKGLGVVYALEDNPEYRVVWRSRGREANGGNGKTIHIATRMDVHRQAQEISGGDPITGRLVQDLLLLRVALHGMEDGQQSREDRDRYMLGNLENRQLIVETGQALREEIGESKTTSAIVRKIFTGDVFMPQVPHSATVRNLRHQSALG